MNKKVKTAIAFTFCCASLWLLWGSTSQLRHMRAAGHHIPVLKRAIAGNPDLRDVGFGIASVDDGILVVSGRVASAAQLARLKTVIMATHPPVKVKYAMHVTEPTPEAPRKSVP